MANHLPVVIFLFLFGTVISVYPASSLKAKPIEKIHSELSNDNFKFDKLVDGQDELQGARLSRVLRGLPGESPYKHPSHEQQKRDRVKATAEAAQRKLAEMDKQRKMERDRLEAEKKARAEREKEASRRLREEQQKKERAEKEHAKMNIGNKKRWT